jgi:translation initiation factor 1
MADEPFHNPFGALARLRPEGAKAPEATPTKPAESPTPAKTTPAKPTGPAVARAVVRLERKGRGGKDVTVVEQLNLNSTFQERWLKELKAALGCGGVIEGDAIVLQGDHRKRLPELLTAKGVRKVTVA